jgi:hypothetical protein
MKYGEFDQMRLNRSLSDFHSDDNCQGNWEISLQENVPYRLDSHIVLTIKNAPFVKCDSCGSTFFVPGFENWLKHQVALDILKQQGMMPKPAIRFLRVLTGKTQKEIADILEVPTDEYNKFESVSNTTRQLNPDRQSRLKGIFADLLNIQDAEVYRRAVYIHDDEVVALPKTIQAESFQHIMEA